VDGYRLDAIGTIYEDANLTPHTVPMNLAQLRRAADLAKTPEEHKQLWQNWHNMFKNQFGQPGLHELMKELRAILDEYDGDRMLVGEDDDIAYMGDGNDELQLVFNFPLMRVEHLTPAHIRRNQVQRLKGLDTLPTRGWGCNTLSNHDTSRVRTRFGRGTESLELARLNAALVLTLRGTPFLYNGEEIGMTDLIITDPTLLRDTMASWYYDAAVNDLHVDPTEAARHAGEMTRDKNRTPNQWTHTPNAGFSPADVTPWLPVNPNYAEGINVQDQQDDPASLLNFYKRLIQVRKNSPALIEGEYRPLHERARAYLAFLRQTPAQTVLVVINYSAQPRALTFSVDGKHIAHPLFSTASHKPEESLNRISLAPYEVLIAELG
jgi:alpha-glucosidase